MVCLRQELNWYVSEIWTTHNKRLGERGALASQGLAKNGCSPQVIGNAMTHSLRPCVDSHLFPEFFSGVMLKGPVTVLANHMTGMLWSAGPLSSYSKPWIWIKIMKAWLLLYPTMLLVVSFISPPPSPNQH